VKNVPKDWKLKLRYGKLKTEFSHYTVIADGEVMEANSDFESVLGPAMMGIKVWATDSQEAADLTFYVAEQVGFKPTGDMKVYDTEAQEPPGENPRGYDINFTAYSYDGTDK